jgi:hypothetical protein
VKGPKRSTLSYANGKRPWQLLEQVFYDQLGLAQSLAPKKKLRFKNKLLSLDASVIDLCLKERIPGGTVDAGFQGPSTIVNGRAARAVKDRRNR